MGSKGGQNSKIWLNSQEMIDLSEAKVEGGEIIISAGYSSTIDLSQMNGSVISASNITLAVGTGGVIELSDNDKVVLQASQRIAIFSDEPPYTNKPCQCA